MEIKVHNEIIEKAKTKKDGVYTYKRNFYVVYKNQLMAYCDFMGNICECCYGFNVSKGKVDSRFEGRKLLKKYLQQYQQQH